MLDTKVQSEEFKFYYYFFLALTFLFAMLMPFSYGDLGIWIAEGRQIMQQGTIYIKDVYSFNPTKSMPYPWLSSLLYHFIDQSYGVDAIFFIHRIIPVLIVAYWLKSFPQLILPKNWFLLVICISGLSMLIVDRPALLTLPFILYTFHLIETENIFKRPLGYFFLIAIWTNFHGSFLIFFALLFYKLCLNAIRQKNAFLAKEKMLTIVFWILATFINPWGYKIYSYVIQTASISKVRMTEWQPLSLHGSSEVLFETYFFVFAVVYLFIFTYRQNKVKNLLSSPIVFLMVSSVLAVRNLPLFYMSLPLFWGYHLLATDTPTSEKTFKKVKFLKVAFNRSIVVALVFIGLFMFSDFSQPIRVLLPSRYRNAYDYTSSFKIADYINSQSTGKKIFNSWILGSFLIYSQKNQIFIDTRNIIYSDNLYSEYEQIMANFKSSSELLLEKYQLDYVIAGTTKGVAKALQTSQNWTFIMEDNGYALFERK